MAQINYVKCIVRLWMLEPLLCLQKVKLMRGTCLILLILFILCQHTDCWYGRGYVGLLRFFLLIKSLDYITIEPFKPTYLLITEILAVLK